MKQRAGARPVDRAVWHRLVAAALSQGEALRQGMTFKALLERSGSDGMPPLAYTGTVRATLKELRGPGLGIFQERDTSGDQRCLLGPGLGLVVGASLGTRTCRAVLVHPHGWIASDPDGAEYVVTESPDNGQLDLPPEALAERVSGAIMRLLRRATADPALTINGRLPLRGIAVAWPCPLHHTTKRPLSSVLRHEDWELIGQSVYRLVAERLGIPVAYSHALNDANAAGLWVAWSTSSDPRRETSARLAEVLLTLRVGGGIGASTVIVPVAPRSGRSPFMRTMIIEGKRGAAGELGHLFVPPAVASEINRAAPRPQGLAPLRPVQCSCGRTTCLEAWASAKAVMDRLTRSGVALEGVGMDDESSRPGAVGAALADSESGLVERALTDVGRLIGFALAGPILLMNPRSVTLTGALAHRYVRDGILAAQGHWSHPHDSQFEVMLPSQHHACRDPNAIVAHGAALAVLRQRIYRRVWPSPTDIREGETGFATPYEVGEKCLMVGPDADLASARTWKEERASGRP